MLGRRELGPRERDNGADIHRLPNELLVEIFFSYISLSSNRKAYDPLPSTDEILITLALVCRGWAGIVLSTPLLWTSIIWWCTDDKINRDSKVRPERRLMLAKSLERSKSSPLSLALHFNLCTTSWTGDLFRSICDIIPPHLARCWSLTVTLVDAECLYDLLPLPGQLANLAYLHLEAHRASCMPGPIFQQGSMSPLQELVIKYLNMDDLDREPEWQPEVPVSKLARVTLSINGELVGNVSAFLEQCPALTRLTLEIEADVEPDYGRPITLPQLQILSITDAIDFELSHYISAPNLHTLTLTGGDWISESMSGWKNTAPHTIYPLLQKLHISIGSLMFMPNLAGLQSFVRANTSIEVLSIEGWTIMTSVLSSLLVDDKDSENASAMNHAVFPPGRLVDAASENNLSVPNEAQGAPTFSFTDQTIWLPNLQSLSSTGGFTAPEFERDPEHRLSPSKLIHAVLMRRPNLHISVGAEWQGTRHQMISEV